MLINLIKTAIVSLAVVISGLLGVSSPALPAGSSYNWTVSSVTDGDTIAVINKSGETRKIRYIGIDTPEIDYNNKGSECFADQAKTINEKLVMGKKVSLEYDVNEIDKFGRYLTYVWVNEHSQKRLVNTLLLEEGAGKYFHDAINIKYQSRLIESAEQGRISKMGLWKVCAENAKTGCVIKGNIDRNDERWYHLPESRHYQQTIVNLNQYDQWFCSEKSAISAGFKKARE